MLRKVLAWCVHGYTALGLVAAGGIAVAIVNNQPASYRLAFLLMFVATLIDATDGTLARAVKVKDVLPKFDGRRLDDLIDFQTYTALPLLLIWRANLLHGESPAWLLAPLLASVYGFCQTNVKTEDGYFLGFPSYWNIIAFYLYVFEPASWFTLTLLVFFALMTFVPARYLYPTHRGRLNRWTCWLGRGLGDPVDRDRSASARSQHLRRQRRWRDAHPRLDLADFSRILSAGLVGHQSAHCGPSLSATREPPGRHHCPRGRT